MGRGNEAAAQLRLVSSLDVVEKAQRPLPRTEFGGGSTRSAILAKALSSTVKPFISVWARVPLLPWPYFLVDYAGLALKPVEGTTFERMELPHCKAEVTRTPSVED